jgi:hypothetical protein
LLLLCLVYLLIRALAEKPAVPAPVVRPENFAGDRV